MTSKYKIVSIATFVLFAVTFLARLYFSGIFATKNDELKDLYEKKISLEKEITRLSYEDSRLSSLNYIVNSAQGLGFVEMKGNLLSLDLKSSSPLAANSIR